MMSMLLCLYGDIIIIKCMTDRWFKNHFVQKFIIDCLRPKPYEWHEQLVITGCLNIGVSIFDSAGILTEASMVSR